MDRKSQIDMFLAQNGEKFPAMRAAEIRETLDQLDDSRLTMVLSFSYKETMTMLLLSIFLGEWGVDRFLLGDTGMGVLKLLTGGACAVLWIIDMIKIQDMTREYNYKKFAELARM